MLLLSEISFYKLNR
ncbi:hypothetical protein VCHC42A1_0638, partial [Vibrio cholerae HC-42A1]